MEMASIGFSWMETNIVEEEKIIFFYYEILVLRNPNILSYGASRHAELHMFLYNQRGIDSIKDVSINVNPLIFFLCEIINIVAKVSLESTESI